MLTLKLDTCYWPTWQLRREPETCTWTRHLIGGSSNVHHHAADSSLQQAGLPCGGTGGAAAASAAAAAAAAAGAAASGVSAAAAAVAAVAAVAAAGSGINGGSGGAHELEVTEAELTA